MNITFVNKILIQVNGNLHTCNCGCEHHKLNHNH
jgi:hypothetical protein